MLGCAEQGREREMNDKYRAGDDGAIYRGLSPNPTDTRAVTVFQWGPYGGVRELNTCIAALNAAHGWTRDELNVCDRKRGERRTQARNRFYRVWVSYTAQGVTDQLTTLGSDGLIYTSYPNSAYLAVFVEQLNAQLGWTAGFDRRKGGDRRSRNATKHDRRG